MIIWLSIYFFVIAVAVALASVPELRAWLARPLHTFAKRIGRETITGITYGCSAAAGAARATSRSVAGGIGLLQRAPFLVTGGLCLVLAPSLLVGVIRGPAIFTLEQHTGAHDRHIETLLRGEHLVPPQPLPPEVFATREVEMVRPDIVGASRSWNDLSPAFTQRLLTVFKVMREEHGYEMTLLEGYRSPERQAALAAKGSHVTRAGAYLSYHQYGLAADCAFIRDGRIVISERDAWAMRGYELYGKVAETYGLNWGGRWSFHDFGHVELRRAGVLPPSPDAT